MGLFFFLMVLDAQIAHLFFKNFPKSSQAKFGFKNGLKGHEFLLFFLESRCFFGLGNPGSLFLGYLGAPKASNVPPGLLEMIFIFSWFSHIFLMVFS